GPQNVWCQAGSLLEYPHRRPDDGGNVRCRRAIETAAVCALGGAEECRSRRSSVRHRLWRPYGGPWISVGGVGYDAVSFLPGLATGWAVGEGGRIARWYQRLP